MTARVECVVTPGTLVADGEEHPVEGNAWIVGDDDEVVVVDAAHNAGRILSAVGDREVLAVVCTHGRGDRVDAAAAVADRDEAPVAVHQHDRLLWDGVYPDREPDIELEDGGVFEVAGETLEILHTPGQTPGAVSLHAPGLGVVFTGDTLARGGPGEVPGATPDYPAQLTSIGEQLLTLPRSTRVLPARGEETTVEAEDANFDDWISSTPGGRERQSQPD